MGQWLIHFDGKQYSAESLDQIKQWLTEGRIPNTAHIYHPSFKDWVGVSEYVGNLPGSQTAGEATPQSVVRTKKPLGNGALIGCVALVMAVVIVPLVYLSSSSTGQKSRSIERKKAPTKTARVKGPSTTKSGYIGCRSKKSLDDVNRFLRNNDTMSLGSYMLSGQCISLEDGFKVTVTDWGFATTEFVYQGAKYYAPSEAIKR